jgi:hypothetical protein
MKERNWSALKNSIFIATALLGASAAMADTIESFNFTFDDPSAGNLMSSGSLLVDVTTDQALSGSGTMNSSLFVGSDGMTPLGTLNMSLVTTSNIGHDNVDSSGGFLWQDSDGTNLQADTFFNPSASPSVDSDGLLFAVGAPNAGGHYASFNFYFLGGVLYGDFLGNGGPPGQGQVYAENITGTLTVTPVPLPATAWLLFTGLSGVGVLVRRRQLAEV